MEKNKENPKMAPDQEQQTLLKIVETWRLSESPEYRGFRCANCQEYKDEAWYHWVNTGDYRLPIHMCDDRCEPAFQSGNIQIDESRRSTVDRDNFNPSYSEEAVKRFHEIVSTWPEYKEPEIKAYTCDDCENPLDVENLPDGTTQRQGWHVWWKMPDGKTLAELHFHRDCGANLGIN